MPRQMPSKGLPWDGDLPDDRFEAALAQTCHAVAEGAHAGQHNLPGRQDHLRIAGQLGPRRLTVARAFSTERRLPMP